jgi:hypothetical protein
MARSIFSMGFRQDPFLGGVLFTLPLTADQVMAQGGRPLVDVRQGSGLSVTFPYVVKLSNNSGEFLVYADGTYSWTSYGSGHVGAPVRIK